MGNTQNTIAVTVKELKASVVGRVRMPFEGGFVSTMVKLEEVNGTYKYVSPMKGTSDWDVEGAMMEEALEALEDGKVKKTKDLGDSGKVKLSFVDVDGNELSILHYADGNPIEKKRDCKQGFFASAVQLKSGPAMRLVRRALAAATYIVTKRIPRSVEASKDGTKPPTGL